jgi:PAS domain S-box-containing protein
MYRSSSDPFSDEAAWQRLIAASERLATARSMEAVVEVLRETARAVVQAEGIAVILRDDDHCFYVAEDAEAPLWAGRRFPAETCISGWAMIHRQTVAIPDIRLDPRIPQDAYRTTFVRSLVVVPIGGPEPVAAIGAYWSTPREHDASTISRLEALARSAATAIENARLIASVQESDRLRTMALAAGRMGVWTLDMASDMLTSNDACRLAFGRDPAADFTLEQFRQALHPGDRQRVFARFERSLTEQADFDIEFRAMTPAAETRWISIRGRAMRSAETGPLLLSGVSIDITDRKRMEAELRGWTTTLERRVEERTAELAKAQDALRQSQKLEAMGQLTGGVAHDFNNLLSPIMGSLDMLHRRGVGTEREQRLIAGALESAERAKILVQRLLAFARRQPLSPSPVDLTALLVEMRPLIGTTLGRRIELTFDLDETLPSAVADRNQIEMAVLNLAVNARDAMPDGGRFTIATRPERVEGEHRAGLLPGSYARLTVSDTGAGMEEETRRRAIEPFYSTKGVGKGTGLGLSMVHGLMSQLGGALALASSPGLGTAIELWLPVSDEVTSAEATEPALRKATPPGIVLLVDDEDIVRATTAEMLCDMGLHVIEARSGAEALALLESGPAVDLIVTDYLMPSMTGAELAAIIRAQRPQTQILLVSGYAGAAQLLPDLPRLDKPFRQADLTEKVAALLASRREVAVPFARSA